MQETHRQCHPFRHSMISMCHHKSHFPLFVALVPFFLLLFPSSAYEFSSPSSLVSLHFECRRSSLPALYSNAENGNQYQNYREETTTATTTTSDGSTVDSANWELIEDWILKDRVPDFTVRGSVGTADSDSRSGNRRETSAVTIATFWRQLQRTTPELSKRNEAELKDRYHVLATTTTTTTSFGECGPSPPVLTNWWMETTDVHNNNDSSATTTTIRMHGTLSNGSNIWFLVRSAGRVGSSSLSFRARKMSDVLRVLEETHRNHGRDDPYLSNYVESSGGYLYELGTPKLRDRAIPSDKLEGSSCQPLKQLRRRDRSSLWTTIATIVVSSVISASLAFSVGQQQTMVSLHSPPPPTTSSGRIISTTSKTAVEPPLRTMPRQPSLQEITPVILGSGIRYERTENSDGTVTVVELSASEQRASQELLVYRNERRLRELQVQVRTDQDQLDRLSLSALQGETEVQRQPAVESVEGRADDEGKPTTTIDAEEESSTLREQRVRLLERKIDRNTKIILRLQEGLNRDRIQLTELKLKEAKMQ